MKSGTISLNAAAAVATLPAEEQVAAVTAGKDELKQAAKRVREAKRKTREEAAPKNADEAPQPAEGAHTDELPALRARGRADGRKRGPAPATGPVARTTLSRRRPAVLKGARRQSFGLTQRTPQGVQPLGHHVGIEPVFGVRQVGFQVLHCFFRVAQFGMGQATVPPLTPRLG